MAHRNVLPGKPFSLENNVSSNTPRKKFSDKRHNLEVSPNVTVCQERGKSRILTIDLYHKRYRQIQDFFKSRGMHHSEVYGGLQLLLFGIYYAEVYVKARQVCENPGCSIRTFWRMVDKLKVTGLVQVKNRYHDGRQISNRYDLDKLLLAIVRYLMERGAAWLLDAAFKKVSKTLQSFLLVRNFWSKIRRAKVSIAKGQIFIGGTP